jgi:hypothetical protein
MINYTSIYISGNLLSPDLLQQLEEESAWKQAAHDFGLAKQAKLRDEIAQTWTYANDYWRIFKRKQETLKDADRGNIETRDQWIVPLLSLLSYNLDSAQKETINDREYDINRRATNLDHFPVLITTFKDSLDRKPERGRLKMSAHGLLQDYLNVTEHTYGLVTNGLLIRLLRDSGKINQLAYIEFNLEKIFDEELYTDFVIFYRLLHASRMPLTITEAKDSVIEHYYEEAIASGGRIRENLSQAVEESIKLLANGFLLQPENAQLRDALHKKHLSDHDFYQQLLRLIYRLVFLMTIEERKIVYPETKDAQLLRLINIYEQYYSVDYLRKLAEKKQYVDGKKTNLWIQLKNTFAIFEESKYARPLGLKALGSGIFAPDACEHLKGTSLYNETLLEAVYNLSFFKDKLTGGLQRANYALLNVEEFGSVYEGLLEYKPEITLIPAIHGGESLMRFSFIRSNERSKSGTHYTPDELVNPLIKYSLDYLIEERIKQPKRFLSEGEIQGATLQAMQEKALLRLKICDVACGSGHILLNAARAIAFELAKKRSGDDQPNPTALREATRDVIRNCIYGVDHNPLAVELCKVALWLESHNPGEPLGFLDHHIKCGDAIVGLAHRDELEKGIPDEAFKTLPDDDKKIAAAFRERNKAERKALTKESIQLTTEYNEQIQQQVENALGEYNAVLTLPESSPEEIIKKQNAYKKFHDNKGHLFLQNLANAQVAQFFIPKTNEHNDHLLTDQDYRQILKGYKGWQDRRIAYANVIAQDKKFFHWFLEFPDILKSGGFDCILGNPPFLGGQKLSGFFKNNYLEYIKYQYTPIGAVDLVTYFFRRIFSIIKQNGFQSLISTKTIAQGSAREGGLDIIVKNGGCINHAVRITKWPGDAAVEVSLITIFKGKWNNKYILSNKEVNAITSYLDDAEVLGDPYTLKKNENKSFQGSIVHGMGFILEPAEAESIIQKDSKNKDILFPYLNGDDLNSHPEQKPSRWVINFFDWPLDKNQDLQDSIKRKRELMGHPYASDYIDCLDIIEKRVKPDRLLMVGDRGSEYWWQFLRSRNELYQTIKGMERVLVIVRVSKYVVITYVDSKQVFMDKLVILAFERSKYLTFLQSNIYEHWAWRYSSTLGAITINFSPSECFESFPFPLKLSQNEEQNLDQIGETYHKYRKQLMLRLQLGLTKIYNLFHDEQLCLLTEIDTALDNKSFEKKFGKNALFLRKHLIKTSTCEFNEAVQGIFKLRELHIQMDYAVLGAYGWAPSPSLPPGEAIELQHGFYDVDYLPETDRHRYTIHPEARREILKRLLELNHQIHEEEVKQGLWKKKKKKGSGDNDNKESNPQIGFNFGDE